MMMMTIMMMMTMMTMMMMMCRGREKIDENLEITIVTNEENDSNNDGNGSKRRQGAHTLRTLKYVTQY